MANDSKLKAVAWYVRDDPKKVTTSVGMANAWDEGGLDVVPLYELPDEAGTGQSTSGFYGSTTFNQGAKQGPELTTRLYMACPACGRGEHRVDHLGPGQSWGPWYCDEAGCGVEFQGTTNASGSPVDVTTVTRDNSRRKIRTLVLLRLCQPLEDKTQVHVVVEGMRFDPPHDDTPDDEHDQYYYNERTCPTNYLGVEAVVHDGDDDPHGIFEWVATVPMPAGYQRRGTDLHELFPQLMQDGTVIDGTLTPALLAGTKG